jgi:hypothetical protein
VYTATGAESARNFTVVTPPAQTITPSCRLSDPVRTSVTITGTNFGETVSGAGFTTHGEVQHHQRYDVHGELGDADHGHGSNGCDDWQDQRHNTGGRARSATNFTVSNAYSRSVTLTLKRYLVAKGVVNVADTFTACEASVPYKIQRRVSEAGRTWERDHHCERVLLGALRPVVTPEAVPGEGYLFAPTGRDLVY